MYLDKMRLFVLVLCYVLCDADIGNDKRPMAYPAVGRIAGSVMKSRLGAKIFAFRGIRYGKPPVGRQRFLSPQPESDWTGVFDATREGPSCPQDTTSFISEDCLRLNVYTTELPTADKKVPVKYPVIMYFHPSGFLRDSGQSFYFGPQYLLDKNVTLVTFNYRLGIFGFLSTGDVLAPGNMGLKDQVLVLRWIQRNIIAFGGDPDNIVMLGDSAGGSSLILHLVSAMSKNLFHKVISMSGTPLKLMPLSKDLMDLTKKQAALLGCPNESSAQIIACLRKKPVQDLLDATKKLYVWHKNPMITWAPVVEPDLLGVERFLSDQPINLIKQGHLQQVPIVMGVTRDEFSCLTSDFVKDAMERNGTMLRQLNDYWYDLAPYCFLYNRLNKTQSYRISKSLRNFYFGDRPIDETTVDGVGQLYADSITNYPVHRTVKLITEHSKQPLYFYKFEYQGRYSSIMWNNTTPYGICHMDDQQYIVYSAKLFKYIGENAPEVPMLTRMISIIANFATEGNPMPEKSDMFPNISWTRFDPECDNYLKLSINSVMKTGFYPDRMREWNALSEYLAHEES